MSRKLCLLFGKFTLLVSAAAVIALPSLASDEPAAPEIEIDGVKPFEWKAQLQSGSDTLLRFTRAITGKPTMEETDRLLLGVKEMTFEPNGLMFTRVDNARLLIPKDSPDGKVLRQEWDEAVENAEKQFGPSGRQFLESIHIVKETEDNHIKIIRHGEPDLYVNLGHRKLHRAFDLKGIRFNDINFDIGCIKDKPALTNIEGVTVVVNAPGLTIPVEVKQFCKWKDEKKNTDVTVAVKNPVPSPLRTIFMLPRILSFHFVMPKKKDE